MEVGSSRGGVAASGVWIRVRSYKQRRWAWSFGSSSGGSAVELQKTSTYEKKKKKKKKIDPENPSAGKHSDDESREKAVERATPLSPEAASLFSTGEEGGKEIAKKAITEEREEIDRTRV
ncbi:hypothetical protein LOK49_LG02G00310 [Camellia lanceoleosa]|uniref:Uncharacterized protein n=1 Tax=Camellia lanceoleosa TaxID=1840588 RepID=A0ACC0IMS0_9ERIC|nr:hypothetical protein LOK49_LG02G00310 [Camellia lanceoleosa]